MNKKHFLPAAAVIAAAGRSTRMGSEKLFAVLDGRPVLFYTLRAFERCKRIEEIILTAREDQIPELYAFVRQYDFLKVKSILVGGKTRQESVKNGVEAVSDHIELLAIHDGARPFVTPQLIEQVLDAAETYGAATAALPVKNTIKQADDDLFVTATLPRSTLWEIQTPQCFRKAIYRQALCHAPDDCTDDCMLVEAAGGQVRLVQGDPYNIKLTTPEDLLTAKIFLEARE